MTSTIAVTTVTEIPFELHQSIQKYLDTHPQWDQDRLITASIALFLLQTLSSQASQDLPDYRICSRIYLEALFQERLT